MFAPIVPGIGIGGWQYLQRTYESQVDLFSKSPQLDRDTEYFRENIGNVKTARELVQDRRLLSVALGAFGLQDDIDNRFFIQKILEEGTTAEGTLANRFSDKRYQQLSEAFSLGPGENSPIGRPEFAERIISDFRLNSFEVAVGQQDDDMRIALYAKRVLPTLIGSPKISAEQKASEDLAGLVKELNQEISADAFYFEQNIGSVATVDDLLSDRRLLEFSMNAFGLGSDYDEIASFVALDPDDVNEAEDRIRSILAEGSISVVSAANEQGDPRYVAFSKAFGFGIAEDLATNNFAFAQNIIDRYLSENVQVPDDLSIEAPILISNGQLVYEPFDAKEMSNDAKWLTLMGEPPLRTLFEKAFNLPSEFGQADIDQQLNVYKERSRREFGTDELSQLNKSEIIDDLIVRFLARSQIGSFNPTANAASIALTLLQS
jgi:hypothetical protein